MLLHSIRFIFVRHMEGLKGDARIIDGEGAGLVFSRSSDFRVQSASCLRRRSCVARPALAASASSASTCPVQIVHSYGRGEWFVCSLFAVFPTGIGLTRTKKTLTAKLPASQRRHFCIWYFFSLGSLRKRPTDAPCALLFRPVYHVELTRHWGASSSLVRHVQAVNSNLSMLREVMCGGKQRFICNKARWAKNTTQLDQAG